MEKLEQKIQTKLIGSKFTSEVEIGDILEIIVGSKARNYDNDIADGADDETEDEYVLYSAYDFKGMELDVIVYYGDVSREIGYVEVRY